MRSLRLTTVAALATIAIAACTGGGEPGWTYEPAPSPTPVVVPSEAPGGSTAPSEAPGGSAVPSEAPSGPVIALSAQNVKFDKATIEAAAGQAFQIEFTNNDAGVLHNVEIKNANGQTVFKGEIFAGVDSRTYTVDPLPQGSYQFICTVHPNMIGTLVVGG